MDLNIIFIIFFTIVIIMILCFFNYFLSNQISTQRVHQILYGEGEDENKDKDKEIKNPKKELIDYFAYNWDDLKIYLINNDCDNINIPIKLEETFYDTFGNYFSLNTSENTDTMMTTFAFRNYQMTFEMEFREICQILTMLKKYILNHPDVHLNTLGKYLELLHHEHFPQAVFISVILDEMLRTCQTYPDLRLHQISQTNNLLTMKIIDSLT
jgi:hypothetical protein